MNKFLVTTAVVTLFASPVLAQSAITSGAASADVMVGDTTITADMDATVGATSEPIATAETATEAPGAAASVVMDDEMLMARITAEELQGARVYDLNDKWIGEVSELVVENDGELSWVIVDVGGFMGIGEKPVAVAYSEIRVSADADGDIDHVMVARTKAELEAMTDYES